MPSGIYKHKINQGFQKGHKPFDSGKTRFKKGHIPPFKGIKGIHLSPKTEWKKGQKAWNKGLSMTWYTPRGKGKVPWNKGKKGEYGTSLKGKPRLNLRGENHWAWKGGVTPINRTIRNSLEMKIWREKVFERDNYTCQFCNKKGGNLNADHIKQFAYFPELRFKISNGRTLCKECHKKTDTFSKRYDKNS